MTKHITIEGVLEDAGIERAGDAEIIGVSFNMNGDLVLSVRDKSQMTGCDVCETMKPADEVKGEKVGNAGEVPDSYLQVCEECRETEQAAP